MSEIEKTVLAIDPGSSKCGLAIAHRSPEGEVVLDWRQVVRRDDLAEKVVECQSIRPYSMIIVGSATKSREIVDLIRDLMPSMGILIVDEKDTSVQARERYWEHNPRRGWRRLLPATLQVPPDPVDDFVALILAERVLGA